ncbi:CgeB family protein [Myxococcus xanthus]|uniref:Glycosyltransferase n=1 Tax=Myxococcus xanthus TaxID=34 RepID=A0A7Y4IFQ5_MYXXA|nr:glycosyltransferase [Myxococcus xanthus]NOJ77800.1 glycosyltransferase [Myxococcus xanthus]NOJ85011.1 glycosyltransferase [Myxococcus xanthus]
MKVVILGLSITSSWGNGHATTYRGLVRGLVRRGHDVWFLERDVPWYAANRDLPNPPHGRTELYASLDDLAERFTTHVREADLVMVGSYVPQGVEAGAWVQRTARGVTAFYDIDTPVTLARLARGACEYLRPELVPGYQLYLSFTGGPTLERIERELGSPAARPLYCSCDPELHVPAPCEPRWELGYLGTYSEDRQPVLERLMLDAARTWPEGRFAVAGPQYPEGLRWPANVTRVEHLAPPEHPAFYNAQRYTLNVTRADMVRAGHSPSVRLFEAAACGVPIISDAWAGLETFFEPGRELFVTRSGAETLRYLREVPERERQALGLRARRRVLAEHTAEHRARTLEDYVLEAERGG